MLDTSQGIGHVRRGVRPFSATNSLKVSAVATAAMGAALAIAPGFALSLIGADGIATGDLWIRTTGAALLALAIVFASASRWPASMMQRPVMLAAAVMATTVAVTCFLAFSGASAGWTAPVLVETLIATWLWWLLVADQV